MELCLLLAKARPEVRIAIAGTGPLLSAFQAFVREHRLERSVDLLGLCADPAPLLHQSRIVVSTSHEEGLPNAIMEAMASGLPVVATDIPGHQDLILNGVSGALVPPRRPELLVPAILGYLDDTRLAAAHGQSGRSRVVERFSLDAVVRQYEALYEELVRA